MIVFRSCKQSIPIEDDEFNQFLRLDTKKEKTIKKSIIIYTFKIIISMENTDFDFIVKAYFPYMNNSSYMSYNLVLLMSYNLKG